MALLSQRGGTGLSGSVGSPLPGPCPGWLVAGILFLLTLAVPAGPSPSAAETRVPGEYQIKAAFLYNFAKFVDWPPQAFGDDTAPLRLCILGTDPFGTAFDQVKDNTVKSRRFTVSRIGRVQEAEGSQILFVSASERPNLRALFQFLKPFPVLTVGETANFCQMGGVINFIRIENKVHFEINPDAARQQRLVISAKLLSLARIVGPEGSRVKE
jgi:hypothetical protein